MKAANARRIVVGVAGETVAVPGGGFDSHHCHVAGDHVFEPGRQRYILNADAA